MTHIRQELTFCTICCLCCMKRIFHMISYLLLVSSVWQNYYKDIISVFIHRIASLVKKSVFTWICRLYPVFINSRFSYSQLHNIIPFRNFSPLFQFSKIFKDTIIFTAPYSQNSLDISAYIQFSPVSPRKHNIHIIQILSHNRK